MNADRRFLHLLYASAIVACALAYVLAVTHPAYGASMGSSNKAYTPFDEPIPKVPREIIADKRLDQKVKVFCKSRCLKDLFADLTAKTGVKITTTRDLSSQRAIIYFHSRPLRDVMTEISRIYNYHWLISGKKGAYEYQLFEDTVRAKRREQVTKDLKAEQDALLLDFTDRVINGGPDADKALNSLGQTNPDAYQAMSKQEAMMNMFAEFGISFLSQALMNGTAMSRCGDLPMAAQTAICDWYNRMQAGSSTAKFVTGPDGSPQLQVTTAESLQALPPASLGDLADSIITMNRVAADATGLPRFELIFKRQSGNGIQSFKTEWPVRSVTADDLRAADDLPVAPKVISDSELPDDPKITIDKLRWLPYRKGLLLGDLLEGIAAQSGKDVIADYYLQGQSAAAMKDQPLKKAVESVCKQFDYTCQFDGQTLHLRQNKWYTQNMYAEPPAQVPDTLWSKIEQNGAVSIRDLLPITSLAADQMKWPGWGFIPGAGVACDSPCTVRLCASLTEAQEKTARKGGLPVSQLSDDQRQKLDAVVAERKLDITPDDLGSSKISMNTVKPEVSTSEGVGKVVTFRSTSSTGTIPPGAIPSGAPTVPPGQTNGQSSAPRVVTWSGSPGSMTGGFASSNGIGDPATWLARLSNSQNETLLLVTADGKPMTPITLSMRQPISEAERKEVIAQRKADKDAEETELVQ